MWDEIASDTDLRDRMEEWRHDLHRYPELGFEETRTAALVSRELRDLGLEVHEGVGGTGVVAVLRKGGSDRAIGLRADMDALAIQEQNDFDHCSRHEGRMHACGHDGHTAMLLGAAELLAGTVEFDGTVVFIFQPAEEHGRGAIAMIEDGLFERFPVQAVYALHNMPSLPAGHFAVRPGPIMAAEDNFEITIHGKGGHAALPHLTVDPIVVGAEVVLALQTLISRTLDPAQNAVLSVTDFKTDGTVNVIADKVVLSGDTRSFIPAVQEQIEVTIHRIVSGICSAHGAKCDLVYDRVFAPTINSAAETEKAVAVARALVGDDKVDGACAPLMASEDFGAMLMHKPGCYLLLGNGGEGPGGCGLHSPHYDFNDDILLTGARFWARLVQEEMPANKETV